MALAQHHGVPTRLLDWSRHPLKAALFAAFGAYEAPDQSGLLSVWALSVEKLKTLESAAQPFIVVTAPGASNANLRAQEGLFTLAKHIKSNKDSVDRRPFDKLLKDWIEEHGVKSPGAWLHHITLPQSMAGQLCFDLALEGFTRATLFPDFSGVVKTMRDTSSLSNGPDTPGGKRMEEHFSSFYISKKVSIPRSEIFPDEQQPL